MGPVGQFSCYGSALFWKRDLPACEAHARDKLLCALVPKVQSCGHTPFFPLSSGLLGGASEECHPQEAGPDVCAVLLQCDLPATPGRSARLCVDSSWTSPAIETSVRK